jgi:predicted DNA-binding protein
MLNLTATTEKLARLVAAKTGKTPETVVREAVEDRAHTEGVSLGPAVVRDVSPEASARRKERMRQIADEIATMPFDLAPVT